MKSQTYLCISIFSISIFLVGCAAPPKEKPNLPKQTNVSYTVQVINNSNRAVPNALVRVRSLDFSKFSIEAYNNGALETVLPQNTKTQFCTTDDSGRCEVTIAGDLSLMNYTYWGYATLPPDTEVWCFYDCLQKARQSNDIRSQFQAKFKPKESAVWGYGHYLSISVSGGGLFGFVGKEDVFSFPTANGNRGENTLTGTAVQEYFCDFLKSPSATSVAASLVAWSNSLGKSIASTTADIGKPNGLCIEKFRDKDYLSISLLSNIKFNHLRLTDYAIGGQIFDEAVRQILTPLGNAAKALLLEGYDVNVKTRRENFASPGNTVAARDLTYRFIMPKAVVERYKNKDITGQQLIDLSVILLNDERIDLKLQ